MFVVEMNNLTGHLVVDGFEAMSLIVTASPMVGTLNYLLATKLFLRVFKGSISSRMRKISFSGLVYFPKHFAKYSGFSVTSNLSAHAWSIKYR